MVGNRDKDFDDNQSSRKNINILKIQIKKYISSIRRSQAIVPTGEGDSIASPAGDITNKVEFSEDEINQIVQDSMNIHHSERGIYVRNRVMDKYKTNKSLISGESR